MNKSVVTSLEIDGYFIIENYLTGQAMQQLEKDLCKLGAFAYEQTASGLNLLTQNPGTKKLAYTILSELDECLLSIDLQPIKAFILDKNLDSNWSLPWHQDTKIALEQKIDHVGFSEWSLESGIVHVEPPLVILEAMLTARIHIDDSGVENGGMFLLPGSHNRGIFPNPEQEVLNGNPICPQIHRGSLMLYRPTLLHRSPSASSDKTRRVLQIEFAPTGLLPASLQWHK